MSKDTCDIEVEVIRVSRAALLVATDDGEEYWIPFSQISDESEIGEESEIGDDGTITISEWIAIEKGLE